MKKSITPVPLLYPNPVLLICTYSSDGRPDAMTAAWAGICCSKPPCISVGIQKSRQTWENIKDRGEFMVCIPPESLVKETDYFGIASGKNLNKFTETGLTPVTSDVIEAPYIEECPIAIACRARNLMPIGSHILIIGEILSILADEDACGEDGIPDMSLIRPLLYDSLKKTYYTIGEPSGKAFSSGMKFRRTVQEP
ncbi:flavin reductase family protein [Methanogenium marinum]|uniref:Flavin reductase family protein n=1 Tax=Methanogenium marinum TaxID=348610 RepID=A0A9Q4KU09_9EURY|nr:flavin reductase family protein [Methanogenium marinum]MDE4907221.1 flavin reductase family protein [Methanogenium marinum]